MTLSDDPPQRPSLFLAEPPPPVAIAHNSEMDVAHDSPDQSRVDPAPDPVPVAVRPRRNPWLFLLWGFAVVLTCGGFWAQLYGIEMEKGMHLGYVIGTGEGTTYSAPSVIDFYVLPVVLASFAPWLVGIGLAAAVAATLVHALAWMRRES